MVKIGNPFKEITVEMFRDVAVITFHINEVTVEIRDSEAEKMLVEAYRLAEADYINVEPAIESSEVEEND